MIDEWWCSTCGVSTDVGTTECEYCKKWWQENIVTDFEGSISEYFWDMKYRFKDFNGGPIDETVEDTWRRVANALAEVEDDKEFWSNEFYHAMEDFKFIPAGRNFGWCRDESECYDEQLLRSGKQ